LAAEGSHLALNACIVLTSVAATCDALWFIAGSPSNKPQLGMAAASAGKPLHKTEAVPVCCIAAALAVLSFFLLPLAADGSSSQLQLRLAVCGAPSKCRLQINGSCKRVLVLACQRIT
jgi:hypothetical protein